MDTEERGLTRRNRILNIYFRFQFQEIVSLLAQGMVGAGRLERQGTLGAAPSSFWLQFGCFQLALSCASASSCQERPTSHTCNSLCIVEPLLPSPFSLGITQPLRQESRPRLRPLLISLNYRPFCPSRSSMEHECPDSITLVPPCPCSCPCPCPGRRRILSAAALRGYCVQVAHSTRTRS